MTNSLTYGQKNALAYLVNTRYSAKKSIQVQNTQKALAALYEQGIDASVRCGDLKTEALNRIDLEAVKESLLQSKFRIIEIGKAFVQVCRLCEEAELPRDVWLRALSVNESEWSSPEMLEHGQSVRHVVQVLNLENSATKDDDIVNKPLNWCALMAMMNATKTNPTLGKCMHDACNEIFCGAFGDWSEPSILQRLGAAH